MTLFNKIQNLANKAKENSQAKSILSKDKRLEQSLSTFVKPDKIWLDLMTTFGLDSKISIMAFDPVAGLLAVGNSSFSLLRIFGRGLSSTIPLTGINGIKYMQFKTGYPTLILLDKKNIIYTIDLKKQAIQQMIQTQGIITSYDYCSGSDWLYLGFADGCIDVFDIRLGKMAPYGIPDLTQPNEGEQQRSSPTKKENNNGNNNNNNVVVAIQCHPTNLNWLLIGYDTMVFLWDIKEQMIHSTFKLDNKPDVRLSSIVWSPQGDRFMAGYDDGYLHLWSIHQEQRPILSRQVFPSLDKTQPCEPVYKLAWYLNDSLQKTYLIVAGGSSFTDIQGLHVLEFDYNPNDANNNNNSNVRDARKQSIIPCSTDVADFILLWNEPYLPRNPLGVLILGTDGSPRAYGLDHGYPLLTLPPSMALLSPFVSNSCFIPMLEEQIFRNLTTYTEADKLIKHLPLKGGVAGPQHIYKLPSNDILLTIHVGEVIQLWDASFASLRPLSQLTIHCHDDIQDTSRYICCIDMNPTTGTLSVGLDDGSIIVYDLINQLQNKEKEIENEKKDNQNQDPQHYDAKFHEANVKFISQCDDTINELEQMLTDMQTPIDIDENDQQQQDMIQDKDQNNISTTSTHHNNNNDNPVKENDTIVTNENIKENENSTNPFLIDQQDNKDNKKEQFDSNDNNASNKSNDNNTSTNTESHQNKTLPSEPEMKPTIKQDQPDDRITILKRSTKLFGYAADLKIKFDDTIQFIVSSGLDIIACATAHGNVYIINTTLQKIIYSFHYTELIQQDHSTNKNQEHQSDGSSEKIELSFIKFINTYPYGNSNSISTQAFIGLSNGNIYQSNIGANNIKWHELHFYRSSRCSKLVQDVNIIDINGKQQNANEYIDHPSVPTRILPNTQNINDSSDIKSAEATSSSPPPPSSTQVKNDHIAEPPKDNIPSEQPPNSNDNINNNNSGISFLRRKSLKRSSTKSTKSSTESSIDNEQQEAWEALSRTSTMKSNKSNSGSISGKENVDDYHYQDVPHFMVITYADSVHVLLGGSCMKLYEFRLNDLDNEQQNSHGTIINTTFNHIDNLVCLSLLLESGQILILSLPHLQPIAKSPLPNNVHKLKESILTKDGRILFWTGQYEMQEWMYLHSETSLPYGNSVQLFDLQNMMPPHPSSIQQQQKNKKGFLGAVAGVFKKEPLSLMELDQIMGRKEQHTVSKANTSEASSSSSPSPSSGIKQAGVFKELSDKMNERGEKLEEMQQKFAEMSDTSNDFLRSVREYNERQAQKKWWEF